MEESSTIFSQNQLRLAEEHYQRGNIKRALDIASALTFDCPNTSSSHCQISRVLMAYWIYWSLQRDDCTHYDVLRISNPFCNHQFIQRRYRDILVKLCPDKNKSSAAKSAFNIINTAWKVLSDYERRRQYNIQKGFWRRFSEVEPREDVREGKRPCIEIIDSDSD